MANPASYQAWRTKKHDEADAEVLQRPTFGSRGSLKSVNCLPSTLGYRERVLLAKDPLLCVEIGRWVRRSHSVRAKFARDAVAPAPRQFCPMTNALLCVPSGRSLFSMALVQVCAGGRMPAARPCSMRPSTAQAVRMQLTSARPPACMQMANLPRRIYQSEVATAMPVWDRLCTDAAVRRGLPGKQGCEWLAPSGERAGVQQPAEAAAAAAAARGGDERHALSG